MHPVISARFHPPLRLGATRLIHLHNRKGERAATRGTNVGRNAWERVIWCWTEFAFRAKKAMAISRCRLSQESLCHDLARPIANPLCFSFCPIFLWVCVEMTKLRHFGAVETHRERDVEKEKGALVGLQHAREGTCQDWSLWQVYLGLRERQTIFRRVILPVNR